LFRSLRHGSYGIWALKEGGRFSWLSHSLPTALHSTSSPLNSLTPSPAGNRAFFISSQERSQFVRYDNARKEFVPFLPGSAGRSLSFSKDGRWVAYTTAPGERLWRSRPDGSDAVQLTPAELRIYSPEWSPDGAWIAFIGFEASGTYGLYAIPSSGGIPRKLSTPKNGDFSPSWSPDGRFLLFRRDPAGSGDRPGLYTMEWKTGEVTPLRGLEEWQQGAWSPDGRRIAVCDGRKVGVVDPVSKQSASLATGKEIQFFRWSRSGNSIDYQELGEAEQPIFRVRLRDRKVERIASSHQIPQSDLTGYSMVGLAPDDAPVAFVMRTNSDIYSLELDLP
jgi:Tol biopolymer transport system component